MSALSTILLIEDDKLIRQTLRENLEKEDFVILEAANGKRGVDILKQHHVNLILLDLNLPDAKGAEFVAKIRSETNVPLIVVSAEPDERKKIRSIEVGADDFIPKPVAMDMLIAKIKAHLRRFKDLSLSKQDDAPNKPEISFDDWRVDPQKLQLFDKGNKSADLTAREFQLLTLLINNIKRPVSRSELCEAIRERNYVPSPRAIDVKITRIRKKIGDNATNPDIIRTIRGVGYMFDGGNGS